MTVKLDKKHILKNNDLENDGKPVTYWPSIYIASALSFTSAAQFSLYFSSLWPYLKIIDRTITEQKFGYIIAIYSLGQIFSSPLFGYWSNLIKKVRPILFVGLFMMFLGNAAYLTLEVISISKFYMLLLGRLVTGIGSGNMALLRSYASTACVSKDRSKAIAFVTCGQAVGLTSGPAFQLLFTFLEHPGYELFYGLHLNLYTAPAYLACATNAFGALILYFLFKEVYAEIPTKKKNENKEVDKNLINNSKTDVNVSSDLNLIALFVCLLTRFTYMFINTNLETIGSPYAMLMFSWNEETTVFYTSLAQGAIGVLTLGIYVIWILFHLEKYLSYRLCCIGSLLILTLFHLITYSWPFLPDSVSLQPNYNFGNATTLLNEQNNRGCDISRFSWCKDLKQVNVYLFYVAYILSLGLAFPILNVTNTTLFGDLLGSRRQGTHQGILQMSGAFARLSGPFILINIFYTNYGPTVAWILEIIVITSTLIWWIILYKQMVPSPSQHKKANVQPVITNKEYRFSFFSTKLNNK